MVFLDGALLVFIYERRYPDWWRNKATKFSDQNMSHCGKKIEFRNLVHEALKSSEFTVCPGVHGAPTLENVLKNVYFETGGLLSRYLCTSKFFAS